VEAASEPPQREDDKTNREDQVKAQAEAPSGEVDKAKEVKVGMSKKRAAEWEESRKRKKRMILYDRELNTEIVSWSCPLT
jgi:hypothetical protein